MAMKKMSHPHLMRKKRAYGGKAAKPEYEYNAQDSAEMKEAHSKDEGFKRGGHPKRKMKKGGHVHPEMAKKRLDKRARGGALSSGHRLADTTTSKASAGHYGEMPEKEPD